MPFKIPASGQQVSLLSEDGELQFILNCIGGEVLIAEELFPKWPEDLNYGDQIVNEEKGEATKALLDICQGKSTIEEAIREYIQTAAMCVRQVIALQRLLNNDK